MFTSLGFGQYLVASPEAGDDVAFHATLYTVTIGWAALLGACGFADQIAPFFDASALGSLIPGMALATALDKLAFIPSRVLTRDMRFKILGVRQMVGEVTYAAVAVALAVVGWGATAVVVGNIARSFAGLAILGGSVSWRRWIMPHRLRWSTTRRLLGFGIPISIGNVLYFAAAKWDNLVIAKMFGSAVVGQYNFAYNLADVPASHVGEQIGDVLVPSFTKLEDDAARQRALARAAGLLALAVFPMALGLGAIAPTLRETFLGSKWSLVGPMLAILSALSVVRPIAWLVGAYLYARRRPRTLMFLEALKAAAILSLIPLFGQLGPVWACVGVGAAFGAYALASVWAVRYQDGMPMRSLLAPLARPFAACLPKVAVVVAIRFSLAHAGWPTPWRLTLEVGAGVLAYGVGVFVIARDQACEMVSLIRGALSRP
jgi:PST family polysaccharide transporter